MYWDDWQSRSQRRNDLEWGHYSFSPTAMRWSLQKSKAATDSTRMTGLASRFTLLLLSLYCSIEIDLKTTAHTPQLAASAGLS
jgi:hypothetical protein